MSEYTRPRMSPCERDRRRDSQAFAPASDQVVARAAAPTRGPGYLPDTCGALPVVTGTPYTCTRVCTRMLASSLARAFRLACRTTGRQSDKDKGQRRVILLRHIGFRASSGGDISRLANPGMYRGSRIVLR